MVIYFLNWMGPVSLRWYEENEVPYTEKVIKSQITKDKEIIVKEYAPQYGCGRIDVDGIEDEPYGVEYSVGVMEMESWSTLANWLDELHTEKPLSKEEIFERFKAETGHEIRWFKKN